jgi:uncharacterized protein
MLSSMYKTVLMLCLMLVCLAVETKAQEPPNASTNNTANAISPAKRELIKELLSLTGDQKTVEAVVNSMLDQNEKDMEAMLARTDKNSPLSPAEQETFKRDVRATTARLTGRFRELFTKRVNFMQVIDDISLPIYDKYFSESELRDLITFYKTPTGRKTIAIYPQLFTETMTKTSEVLTPKIRKIIDEIMAEEKAELDKLVRPIPAPTAPARTKKRRRRS